MIRSLQPCPSSPNCVSTQASDQGHGIVPYRYQKTLAGAKETLKTIVANLPRAKLVEEDEAYLHYEFTSLLLRFVDDVEFVFDDETKTIHFRSASRTGYSDLGVNRRRMEEIRVAVSYTHLDVYKRQHHNSVAGQSGGTDQGAVPFV